MADRPPNGRLKAAPPDVAQLRRKFKDPSFSPAALLEGGSAILDRASKLKGFVAGQRGKLTAAATRAEWLLVSRQLGEEADAAEREVAAALMAVVTAHHQDVPELIPCLEELRTMGETCRAERMELR